MHLNDHATRTLLMTENFERENWFLVNNRDCEILNSVLKISAFEILVNFNFFFLLSLTVVLTIENTLGFDKANNSATFCYCSIMANKRSLGSRI